MTVATDLLEAEMAVRALLIPYALHASAAHRKAPVILTCADTVFPSSDDPPAQFLTEWPPA